jgi:hypothetical protein
MSNKKIGVQEEQPFVTQRFIWKETADGKIVNGKLISPNPGIAYVADSDSICLNNVVLPKHDQPEYFEDTK